MPSSPLNRTDAPYQFQTFEVSYFSAKVRPALRYKGLWYEERRADLADIKRRTGLTFIPIVVTPEGETWQDSTDIYHKLEERHPDPPLYPAGALQRVAAQIIELYCDEFGLIPAMHYRWGSELGEASGPRALLRHGRGRRELGNMAADRMVQARFIVGASRGGGPRAIEEHTRDLLAALSDHFETAPLSAGRASVLRGLRADGPGGRSPVFTDLVSRRLLLETADAGGGLDRSLQVSRTPISRGSWLEGDALAPSLVECARDVMGSDAVHPSCSIMLRTHSRPGRISAPRTRYEWTAPGVVGMCAIVSFGVCPSSAPPWPTRSTASSSSSTFYRGLDAGRSGTESKTQFSGTRPGVRASRLSSRAIGSVKDAFKLVIRIAIDHGSAARLPTPSNEETSHVTIKNGLDFIVDKSAWNKIAFRGDGGFRRISSTGPGALSCRPLRVHGQQHLLRDGWETC